MNENIKRKDINLKVKKFFEKYFGLSANNWENNDEIIYEINNEERMQLVVEETEKYKK